MIGLAVLGAIGAFVAANLGGGNNGGDAGIDVSGTPCEALASARAAVDEELESRTAEAEEAYTNGMEAASDAYWAERRSLEDTKTACETEALLADPCKDLFERGHALAQDILNNIDDGFDEAKAQERDDVLKQYDDCVENPPEDQTYEGMKAACEAAFTAGDAAAQQTRTEAEAAAAAQRDAAIEAAESQHAAKVATLDAIAAECNKPAPVTSVGTGGISTGSTGTVIQSGSPACTGRFTGYDPEIQSEISRLQSLYEQARFRERQGGIGGADTYAAKLTELRAEMAAGPRKCTTDAFCGDTEPVCCSGTEVGQVACVDGVCVSEKTECEDPEVCAGKPAQCVSPTEGAQSAAVNIERSITIGASCSNTIQTLDLQQASSDSLRFEITGNIPDWLSFSHVGGALPQSVDVNAACSTLQGRGPGTYTASGTITVFNANDELINTIPLNVNIEVRPGAVVEEEEPIGSVGQDVNINTNENTNVAPPPDEPAVSVGPTSVSFTYDHANPVCPLQITPLVISGPPGSEWYVDGELPIWLQMPNGTSGTVPATVPLQFPCLLDTYENQTQASNIPFVISTPDDTVELQILVTANITNFDE